MPFSDYLTQLGKVRVMCMCVIRYNRVYNESLRIQKMNISCSLLSADS
jgi:hypothetical protein